MKLSLHPGSKFTLELEGNSVTLSAADLAALRECLPDSGRSPDAALPRALFRRLFETGILTPSELSTGMDISHWQTVLPGYAVSPYLHLRPVFMAGDRQLHDVEPAIAMFLKPEFVAAATQLSGAIREALAYVTKACAVRDTPFPRERALSLVHGITWKWLQERPELAAWLTWSRKNDGSLTMTVADYENIKTSAPAYPWILLNVAVHKRQGSSQERQVVVPIETLPSLARVLDALREDWRDDSVLAELAQAPVQRVLGAIEAIGGFIERGDAPTVFKPRLGSESTALSVTHMGHASLIVDAGTCRILIDPWLFSWDDTFEKQPVVSRSLGRIDAIFFTHHHGDHMNVESLLTLPHDVPVFVPCRTSVPLEPRIADFLRLVGFRDVREFAHGEAYTVGDDLSVEAVPFFGEGQNRLGFGANCYLISRHGQNVLIHADAAPDSNDRSLVSSGVLRQIVDRHGPIQAVFGTWWQERTFLCNLSPLAIFSPRNGPEMWLEDTENCDCPPEFLHDMMKIAGAKLLVLYAESGKECFLPRQAMSAYVPSISFLWRSIEDIRKIIRAETGAEVVEAHPYMRLVIPEQGVPYTDKSDVAPSRSTY